jgi:chaperone required for assembly of F1-ATPase
MSGENDNGGGKREPARIPIRDSLRAPPPKRFYSSVTIEPATAGFRIMLDGKPVRTPAKRELALPAESLAAAVAAEWRAQGERIDPATMPLTRLANTALDAVAGQYDAVAEDIVAYAGSDLLCYRAEGPAALVRRQAEAWDPILDWARRDIGADLVCRSGVVHVEQPASALAAIRRALEGLDPFELAAMHVLTTLSGSAVLALALDRDHLSVEDAWTAAVVDETWQSEQWGVDAEAEARLKQRRADFDAAGAVIRLLRTRR